MRTAPAALLSLALSTACAADSLQIPAGGELERGPGHGLMANPGEMTAVRGRGPNIPLHDGLRPEPRDRRKPLGPKPEEAEDIRLIFLRQSSVLLKPGQIEAEAGVEYQRTSFKTLGVQRDLQRFLAFPLNLRAGIIHRLEGFLVIPAVYGYRDYAEYGTEDPETGEPAEPGRPTLEATDDQFGLGDIAGGVSYQLVRESGHWPALIGSLRASAPTGSDPYGREPGVGLGSGHWTASGRLQFVRTMDPVAVFWSLDYTHAFEETYSGSEFQPGDLFTYSLGVGFAVNPQVSLSGQFLGGYRDDLEADGEEVDGSSQEPFSLRLGLTVRWLKDLYVEPSVAFGLNDDAPDATVGVALITRFDFR